MKVKINGEFINFYTNITITHQLDAVASVFSFDARFNPDNATHRNIFRPLSYNIVEIFDNDDNLKLTGVAINTSLKSSSSRSLQTISGYSKAGILEDCTIPYSAYPLEMLNLSLKNIATKLLKEFGLGFIIDGSVKNEMNANYEKSVAKPDETVKSFLSKLASQKNIILSHDNKGNLIFFKPNDKERARASFDDRNTTNMTLSVSGQALHSNITVIRQPSKDNPDLSAVDTIRNPLVKIKRTLVKTLSSGSETDTARAANNVLADELKSISVQISLDRYYHVNCGDIVEVQNPEIFLYEKTRLMVSEITVNETALNQSMSLKLVLPETFTGNTPKNIFL